MSTGSLRHRQIFGISSFRLALFALLVAGSVTAIAQQPALPVPEISADLGTCTANFHVTDMGGNPLYNAQIHTVIRYGFMSKRKLELDAGTNSDGRVRFVKLPEQTKKPVEFTISNGSDTAKRSFSPDADCHATFEVPLKK
jgi:hypothetical protein